MSTWIETAMCIDVRMMDGNGEKTDAGKVEMHRIIQGQVIVNRRIGRAKQIVRSSHPNVTAVRNSRLNVTAVKNNHPNVTAVRNSRLNVTAVKNNHPNVTAIRNSRPVWMTHGNRRSATGSNDHKSTVRSGNGTSKEIRRIEIAVRSEPVTINHSSANASRHSVKHHNGRSRRSNLINRENAAGDRLTIERMLFLLN